MIVSIAAVSMFFGIMLAVGVVGSLSENLPVSDSHSDNLETILNPRGDDFIEIVTDSPRPITWSIAGLPEVQYKEMAASSVARGFEIWEQKNPSLDFEAVEGPADIEVRWEVEPAAEHVGLAEYTEGLIDGTITIYLGDYDCNGNYVQWGQDAITDTTMHEVGHILGLGHHADESHLMYGIDDDLQINFQTLGYDIPDTLGNYFVGEKAIQDKIVTLGVRLADLDGQYTAIIESRGMTVEDYESGRVSISSKNFERSINPVIDEYNRLVEEYNTLVDDVHCYHNKS